MKNFVPRGTKCKEKLSKITWVVNVKYNLVANNLPKEWS